MGFHQTKLKYIEKQKCSACNSSDVPKGGVLMKRTRSGSGKFLACSRYPDCLFTVLTSFCVFKKEKGLKKQPRVRKTSISDTTFSFSVYIDGACEPMNPGGTASYGVAVYKKNKVFHEESEVVGTGSMYSSNVAEYSGFIAALNWLLENKHWRKKIIIYSDSKLVINQMFGTWDIKKGLYKEYAHTAQELVKKFKNLKGKWIPRELNTHADALSKAHLL